MKPCILPKLLSIGQERSFSYDGLQKDKTTSLIDNRIDTMGINIVPIQFHTKPRSLRHQHMPIGVNIL